MTATYFGAARDTVHADLVELLGPGFQVEDYAPQLDNVQGPTLLLRLGEIEPRPEAGRHVRVYNGAVLAVAPVADIDPATVRQVDELAGRVLDAIDLSSVLSWSKAERVSVDDTWTGWEISITTHPLVPTL